MRYDLLEDEAESGVGDAGHVIVHGGPSRRRYYLYQRRISMLGKAALRDSSPFGGTLVTDKQYNQRERPRTQSDMWHSHCSRDSLPGRGIFPRPSGRRKLPSRHIGIVRFST